VFSLGASFGDFCWDADMTLEEIMASDPVVIIDVASGPRRMVVQRLRGELRYWITEDRDPRSSHPRAGELGTLADVDDVVSLCAESLPDRHRSVN